MTDNSVSFDRGGAWGRTSTEFLQALKAKDDTAWRRVLTRACWQIYAVAGKYGLPQEEADDIVQEVVLAASERIGFFEHNGRAGAFRAWLNAIVRTRLAQHGRDRALRLDLPVGGTDMLELLADLSARHPAEPIDSQRRWLAEQLLEMAREVTSPTNWDAFYRVVFAGQSPEDVAADLAISVNQVYLAKSRTIRQLRLLLQQEDEAP